MHARLGLQLQDRNGIVKLGTRSSEDRTLAKVRDWKHPEANSRKNPRLLSRGKNDEINSRRELITNYNGDPTGVCMENAQHSIST